MCGIGGLIRYGDAPIEEIQIRLLLLGLEHRGNDATGIAIQRPDGSIAVCKSDDPAGTFLTMKKYEDFIREELSAETRMVLLHTRLATKGTPRKNENNHPLWAGDGCVVHNGMLHNDDYLFGNMGLDRKAETDTDIFRALVDKHGITRELVRDLNRVTGSAAIAAMHPNQPGKMLIGRSGNPIETASNDDHFVFASEKNIIHRAMRPWVKRWGMDFQRQSLDLSFMGFPNETAWIMGPEGREWHERFALGSYTGGQRERTTYTRYSERQQRWATVTPIVHVHDHSSLVARAVGSPVYGQPYLDINNKLWLMCEKCKNRSYISAAQRHAFHMANKTHATCSNKNCVADLGNWAEAFKKALGANVANKLLAEAPDANTSGLPN